MDLTARERVVLAAAAATALLVFALDMLTPVVLGVRLCYIFPLLLASGLRRSRVTFSMAGILTVFIGLDLVASPGKEPGPGVAFNAMLAVVVLWIAARVLVQRARAESEKDRVFSELEDRVRQRAEEIARTNALLQEEIRAHRRTAEALGSANERLSFILETITDARFVLDQDWRFFEVNPVAEAKVFRRSASELVGKVFWEVYPHAVGTVSYRQYHMAVTDGCPVHFEAPSAILEGAWLETHAYPRQGLLEVYVRDITARKRAEAERERLIRELAAEKTRWETTVESMLDPVTVCDTQGRATYMNAAYCRLTDRIIRPGLELAAHPAYYQLYRPDGTLFAPEELPLQRAALTGQDVRDAEVVQRRLDGTACITVWNAAPLRDPEGRVTGAVAAGRDITEQRQAEEALSRAHEALAEQLGQRTAALRGVSRQLAVERTHHEEAEEQVSRLSLILERRVAELIALHDTLRALATSLDVREVVRTLTREVRGLLGVERVLVLRHLPEEKALAALAAEDEDARAMFPITGFLGRGLHEARAFVVNDVREEPETWESLAAVLAVPPRSMLAVPLQSAGQVIGLLVAMDKTAGGFDEDDARILTALASSAAIYLENARLYASEQGRRWQLEAVRAVTSELTRELDLPRLLGLIARRAGELIEAVTGTVWLWDEDEQCLLPGAWVGHDASTLPPRLRLGEGVAGRVAERRQGLIVNDYQAWPHALPEVLTRTQITAVLAEPLLCHDRLLGVVALDNERTGRSFGREDAELLALFAAHAAIAIENATLYREVLTQRDRLQALATQVMAAREEEAKRIARELHDEVGQSLSCLLLGLQALEQVEGLEELRRRLTELRSLVAKPLADVQRLIRAIRPSVLDDLGLAAALERHVQAVMAASGLHVEFYGGDLEGMRLAPDTETALYRIAQEALTNVVKHAKAQHVSVILRRRGPDVVLVVEDDGQGFDPGAARRRQGPGTGLGLLGMAERARLANGRMTVESHPGKGTTVLVEVPVGPGEGSHGKDARPGG